MVDVKLTYQSGNRRIVIHNDDPDNGPTVYTEEEAREIRSQLDTIL